MAGRCAFSEQVITDGTPFGSEVRGKIARKVNFYLWRICRLFCKSSRGGYQHAYVVLRLFKHMQSLKEDYLQETYNSKYNEP